MTVSTVFRKCVWGLILVLALAFALTPTEASSIESRIESFRRGALLQEIVAPVTGAIVPHDGRFNDAGHLIDFEVSLLHLIDVETNESLVAVMLQDSKKELPPVYFDAVEAQEVVRKIDLLIEKTEAVTKDEYGRTYTEFVYRIKHGVVLKGSPFLREPSYELSLFDQKVIHYVLDDQADLLFLRDAVLQVLEWIRDIESTGSPNIRFYWEQ